MAGSSNASNETIVKVITDHNRKAGIWGSYNMVLLSNGIKKAQCKMCGALLGADGNSTLRRHTEKTCPTLKAGDDPNQPILDNHGQIWAYDAQLSRQMMAKCVIQTGLPFSHFDNPHITKMIQQCLQPRYTKVTRNSLRSDAIKMWKTAKLEMAQMFLSFQNNVSLTCDVWTAPHGLPVSYICITAHWIDPQTWQLYKRVITFESFGAPHSGDRQFAIIKKSLLFYNLYEKILTISFDNASNNKRCVDKLRLALLPFLDGKLFHTRCCAHIINLAVQDGLTKCKFLMDKFRLMLRRIFTKGKKIHQAYIKFCKDVNFTALGANFDMPVRWNSTYFMIESMLKQKNYLQQFYNIHYPQNSIVDDDWVTLQGLYDILGVFKNATTILSGIYYPTSPLLLQQLLILALKISQYENHPAWKEMIISMKKKLLKYFIKIPFSFLCAAALNPCLNVVGVEVLITKIAFAFKLDTPLSASYSIEAKRVFNRNFEDLFDIYNSKYGGARQQHYNSSSNFSDPGSSSTDVLDDLMNDVFNETSKKSRFDNNLSELNIYLRTRFVHDNVNLASFDILDFWKNKKNQFPVLARIALDILTIQASTVASESAFSLSGRIISVRRSRLTPESVECCVCLKDYLDGVERTQHLTSLEDEMEAIEINLEENENEPGASTSEYNTDTDNSVFTQYEDDDELDIDDLDDDEAIRRITTTGTPNLIQPYDSDDDDDEDF